MFLVFENINEEKEKQEEELYSPMTRKKIKQNEDQVIRLRSFH